MDLDNKHDAHDTLNEIVVSLFNDIMDLEQKALITDKFTNISNNDMHIIEAIGDNEPKKMSQVAKSMKVTVGTLTIAMNGLVNKGYVIREKSLYDRRVVLVSLSELGLEAFRKHAQFHEDMVQAIMQDMDPTEMVILVKALKHVRKYFNKFS